MKAEMTRWRLERRHKTNERPMFHFLAYPYCSHRPEQLCLWCHEGRPPVDQEKAKEAIEAWQRHLQEVKWWEIRQLKKEEEEDKKEKDEGSKKRRILTQEEYEAEEKAQEKKEKEEKEETERLNIAKWMMMSDEELINRLD